MRSIGRASDRAVTLGLVLFAVLLRLPFVSRFDFVSFDGTYYLNQARALTRAALAGGSFPIGYPLVVAPVLAIVRDPVLAGMMVSLAAGVGTVLASFALARRALPRAYAIGAALIVAATPLLIDASLATLSESAYLFWVMLGLCLFGAARTAGAGLTLGMAAATRPEALAVAGVLGLLRLRAPRALARFVLAFVLVYGASVAVLSAQQGSLTFLSRAGAYRSLSEFWALRESSIEYEGKAEVEARAQEMAEPLNRGREYSLRVPRDLARLSRHTMVVLPLLAVAGLAVRRRARRAEAKGAKRGASSAPVPAGGGIPLHLLAALAPLPFIPLFTEDRGVVRWLAPYVPAVILFGIDGLARVRAERARVGLAAVVGACAVLSFAANGRVIGHGIEHDFDSTRAVAGNFAARVEPGDRIADRKPYFAFYAGAPYVEIPISPYDETMAHLAREGVRYVSLHPKAIHSLRPALRPLLYDHAAMRGELRYRQVLFRDSGEIVYERALDEDPARYRRLTTPAMADLTPAWSPDGSRIAFRRYHEDGSGSVMLIDAGGGNERELAKTERLKDALAWSPDGTRLAFAATVGNAQGLVVCDVRSGRLTPLAGTTRDFNPSWCRGTGEMLFISEREGNPAVFRMPSPGGRVARLSAHAPADLVSVSPSGAYVTWSDLAGRLVVFETATARAVVVAEPIEILSAASWSPDERHVVVEAYDWGSANVYMIDVQTGRALMLTRTMFGEGMPTWSPKGDEIVVVSARDKLPSLWSITRIDAYRARLLESEDVRAFQRPDDTRAPAPPGARRLQAAAR